MQPTVTECNDGFRLIDWPAVTYIESNEQAICVDKGGRHLGEATPGVAVPFPTRNHGELHKNFGITEDENGHPVAYGKAASITSWSQPKETLAAVRIGGEVIYKGVTYTVVKEPNNNIKFIAA